ncbi:hypothetical protein CR513_05822, partial [Mucuna pruriens]
MTDTTSKYEDGEEKFSKLSKEFESLKKKENDILKKENEKLKEEQTQDLSKVNTSKVNKQLQKEVIDLRQSLGKFVNGQENLKSCLNTTNIYMTNLDLGFDKKKEIKREKSNFHCFNYRNFGHMSYDCKERPK